MKFFRNLILSLIINYKYNKAVLKWNRDFSYIQKCVDDYNTTYNPEPPGRAFYWNQLVWQEIRYYIRVNEKVSIDDFSWLCSRRGFTLDEQNYLQNMLEYVGLWKGK